MSGRKKKTLLLIDGNNYINRGFYATPPLSNSDGFPTNAIRGFFHILCADYWKLKPDAIIVAFDKGGADNWRKKLYPEYKANRVEGKKTDEYKQMSCQFSPIRKLVKAVGIPIAAKSGEEADDLIGTLSRMYEEIGYRVLVSSRDKDFAQLVSKNTFIVTAGERELLGAKQIREIYGVGPELIADYLTLVGDKVDNVPGVYNCGGKTAAKLLLKYGSVKGIVRNADSLTAAMKKNVLAAKPMIRTAYKLVTIDRFRQLKLKSDLTWTPNESMLSRLCDELELTQTFNSLIRMINHELGSGTISSNERATRKRF